MAEEEELVEAFRAAREEAYRSIVAGSERVRRKAALGGGDALKGESLKEQLAKLERAFRAERRRDYFRSPSRNEAAEALRAARRAVRGEGADAGGRGAEGAG